MVPINRAFASRYQVNLDEAEKSLRDYRSLQDFFVRKLKPETRPIDDAENVLISPCDGTVSVQGILRDDSLMQIKGRYYTLSALLQDSKLSKLFRSGSYATIYLSPRDYHRFHVPMDGIIEQTIYVPGALWPVNNWAVTNIPNLFCENERVITLIRCPKSNLRLAHIAVGATMVGKIELVYCNLAPFNRHEGKGVTSIAHETIILKKGEELGKFMFGSTIVLIGESGLMDGFYEGPRSIKMGEALYRLRTH